MKKIVGVTYYGKRTGLLYNDAAVKLRDIYDQLDDIVQSNSMYPTKRVAYLLHSINSSNVDMYVGKENFMNYRRVIAIYFEAAVSYLKNCLPMGCTSLTNIHTTDTNRISKMKRNQDTD